MEVRGVDLPQIQWPRASTWSRIFLESSAKETAMGKLPIRRSQASERTPALPVSSTLASPAQARRKPAPVAAPGPGLQRAALLGHSVQRVAAGLIQPKLTLGPVADSYEHEADSVAQQVMQHISSPDATAQPAAPAPEAASSAPGTAQRALPEDELKKKPLPGAVQRLAPEDELKKKPLPGAVQRAPEDELKMKPLPGAVQRMAPEDELKKKPLPGDVQRAPEDELKMKPLPGSVQRAPEDELKMKPLAGTVQRAGEGIEGGPIGADLERSIEGARSGGSALDAGLRVQMEPAFGADFGGVRVHSDSQSHQLNQSLQARAFTTGQDIFFRGGEYQPQSSAGKELIAHELTHVVQQGGSAVTKKAPS
jgi:hypothetical protein